MLMTTVAASLTGMEGRTSVAPRRSRRDALESRTTT
jgi:hypothetical protein